MDASISIADGTYTVEVAFSEPVETATGKTLPTIADWKFTGKDSADADITVSATSVVNTALATEYTLDVVASNDATSGYPAFDQNETITLTLNVPDADHAARANSIVDMAGNAVADTSSAEVIDTMMPTFTAETVRLDRTRDHVQRACHGDCPRG